MSLGIMNRMNLYPLSKMPFLYGLPMYYGQFSKIKPLMNKTSKALFTFKHHFIFF